MTDKPVSYTIRINRELFAKFRYIANKNVRSINREIEQQMNQHVTEFEKEHGEIEVNMNNKPL